MDKINNKSALPEIEFERKLTIAEMVGAAVGIAYLTGYLIHSIFIRNYGILEGELLRADYIVIGITFLLLSSTITLLPLGALYLTYHVRKHSGLPHFVVGLIGNTSNTLVFLSLLVFLPVFVTRHEWELHFPSPFLGLQTCKAAFMLTLSISLFGMAVLPLIERLIFRIQSKRCLRFLYLGLIEPLRFGILIVSFVLAARSIAAFSWSNILLTRGATYFCVLIFTSTGMVGAYLWIRYVRPMRGTLPVYALVGSAVIILYFVSITSYVYGVFNFIPTNRGGRLPLTMATLEVETAMEKSPNDETASDTKSVGPVCMIEETSDTIYYATIEDMARWLKEFIPVHAVRKDKVSYRHLERIENGFPRVSVAPKPTK